MAASPSPAVHITQCSGPQAFRIKGHFDATGEISGGKPVYRKRDGDYVLHYWLRTGQWIVAGSADFRDGTGRSWAVLEASALVHAALSKSEWQVPVIAGAQQAMCVEAFAYGV
jgi:hypothetical protein